MKTFTAKILKIGINPYVLLPQQVLKDLFMHANSEKSPIPVKGKIDGHPFIQTLVKYSGKWRLYLNTPMRLAAGKDVGDTADIHITYDAADRTVQMHPRLEAALKRNKKARLAFEALIPSRRKEILRYLHSLKTEASVERNIQKAIGFLLGREPFIGRDKP